MRENVMFHSLGLYTLTRWSFLFHPFTTQLLHLTLRDYCRRKANLMVETEQEICCEVASPRNIQNYTHGILPALIPTHEMNTGDPRNMLNTKEENALGP